MTNNELASIVALLLPWSIAPPEPSATFGQGDYPHVAHLFAGTFEGEVLEPPEVPVEAPTGSLLRIYSDIEMNCPQEYYGGPKDARVERTGYGERMLSDMVTGAPTSSTFTYRLADRDYFWRRALASEDQRYWPDPVTVHMTSRDARAALEDAFIVFNGPIINAQPARPLSWEFTLGDIVTHRLINDRAVFPYRKWGDGFIHDVAENTLGLRVQLSTAFDYETPEATIYGEHRRVRNVDPPSQHGFEIDLTKHYLGVWNIAGADKHVWGVCGHATADIPDVNRVAPDGTRNTVIPDEGIKWWIPHYTGWDGIYGAPYVDVHSTSFGNPRRYTLILGAVGDADVDACAFASGGYPLDPAPEPQTLYAFVDGVEEVGDGSGATLVFHDQCFKHWWKNYGSRSAGESYAAGNWLDSPVWTLRGRDGTPLEIPIVDESSFDDVGAINAIRFPDLGGYICAAILGARAGDIHPMDHWRAMFNRSGFCVDGFTHLGQVKLSTPHPTAIGKAAAHLYTDALEHRQGSFESEVRWSEQANRIPWRNDIDYTNGEFKGASIVDAGDSILNYDREIIGEVRELEFAPGVAMGNHIAQLHAYLFKHKPIRVTFEDTVGPDENGESLGYAEIGDYIRYRHYAAVGSQGQERLAWVVRHQVQAGRRRVLVEAWDLEDLIGFDIPLTVDPTVNETCEEAIEITNGADEAYAINLDTTGHATDAGVAAIAGLPGPAVGYHAAWFTYTPAVNGTLFLTTVHSQYDTQLAVNTGDCGDLTNIEYNDNDGLLLTSILEFSVTGGVPLRIVVYGYGPDDGGPLTFGLLFTAA